MKEPEVSIAQSRKLGMNGQLEVTYLLEILGVEQNPADFDDLGGLLCDIDTVLIAGGSDVDDNISVNGQRCLLVVGHCESRSKSGSREEIEVKVKDKRQRMRVAVEVRTRLLSRKAVSVGDVADRQGLVTIG